MSEAGASAAGASRGNVREIRVELPFHLRVLAGVTGEVRVSAAAGAGGEVTLRAALEALEAQYPMLRGTIRDQVSGERRAFLRFFAGGEDRSHEGQDAVLPEAVAEGREALLVIGAVAGG